MHLHTCAQEQPRANAADLEGRFARGHESQAHDLVAKQRYDGYVRTGPDPERRVAAAAAVCHCAA